MSDLYGVSRRRLVGETSFWIAVVLALAVILVLLGLGWRYVIADARVGSLLLFLRTDHALGAATPGSSSSLRRA